MGDMTKKKVEKKSLEEIYTYYQSSDSIQVYENYKLEGVY